MLKMFVWSLSLYNIRNRGVFLLCKITNLLIYSCHTFIIAVLINNAFKTVQQSAKDKEAICRRTDARQRYLTQDFTLWWAGLRCIIYSDCYRCKHSCRFTDTPLTCRKNITGCRDPCGLICEADGCKAKSSYKSKTATALFPTNSMESVRPAKISKISAAIPYPTPTVIPQRSPFLILSDCPAPRFWLQNTDAEVG